MLTSSGTTSMSVMLTLLVAQLQEEKDVMYTPGAFNVPSDDAPGPSKRTRTK